MERAPSDAAARRSFSRLAPPRTCSYLGYGLLAAAALWFLAVPASERLVLPPLGTYWSLLALLSAFGLGAWLLQRLQCRIDELERAEALREAELDAARKLLARTARQARGADTAKSEFLAAMSHELRTPLNAIIGFAEILNSEMLGPLGRPEYVDYSKDIRECGHQLLQVVNDILDLSRAQSGGIELNPVPLDVTELVDEVVDTLRGQADANGVAIEKEIASGLSPLEADERRVRQMLAHLISNGIKFTPSGGRITVAARREHGDLALSVKDTGIGIAPEHMERALTPFGQVDGKRNRNYGGTGLGLPLTRSLVSLHGGTFDICSTAGEGTTVTLTFPLADRAEAHRTL